MPTFAKEFKDLPYDGYVRKRPKHIPTNSYFYLVIHLEKCMMRNLRGPLITQNISTQKMNNYNTSTQKMSNSHVCSKDERESKSINADESK